MTYYKQLFYSFLLLIVALPVHSQTNGSNSPYSRFGVGSLNDQSQGFNKAMSGLSMGWRDGKIINKQNPASYSAIDSLTFIFDVGMMLQNANFKSGGNSVNAHNTSLEYVNGAFRLCPGFAPFIQSDHHFHAALFEVERMSVALAAVADDGDRLVFQNVDVAIGLIIYFCHCCFLRKFISWIVSALIITAAGRIVKQFSDFIYEFIGYVQSIL